MMKKIKSNITLLNTISNVILQILTLISGFIIPKIILSYFGSSVNGLVSSINQFLSYISLVEGGITGVLMAKLYKPLYEKDNKKISSIVKTANNFYRKIGLIFIIYSVILAFIYPIIFKVEFSYIYVFVLILILSINLFIQYMFSLTFKSLLNADKKVYIVSFTQSIIVIINIILGVVSVKIYPNIHVFKLLTGLTFILQPVIFNFYVKKYYKINKDVKEDKNVLESRWSGFAVNIAAFIHNSTDIVILTLFTNFKVVSIYSVYTLVTAGLKQIVSAISSAITPTIGEAYSSGDSKLLNKKFDLFEYINFFITFLFFTVAGLLITSFVMIYTKDVTDTNYYRPLFGVLIVLSEFLYLIKSPHLNLSYIADKFKEISIHCYIEAGINILLSLVLVNKFGLIGVAIGTCVAMIYRMIYHVYFTKKLINRPQKEFYKKLFLFSLSTLIGVLICIFIIPEVKFNIMSWVIHGILYTIILLVIYVIISILFYKEDFNYFVKFIKK